MTQRNFHIISLAAVASLLYIILIFGMLTTLIALCCAFILADRLDTKLLRPRLKKHSTAVSTVLVGLLPFLLLALIGVGTSNFLAGLEDEFKGLSLKLVDTLATWRKLLPESWAAKLPDDAGVKTILLDSLKSRAGYIAAVGKSWVFGAIQVIVGTVIGVLLYKDTQTAKKEGGLFSREITTRARAFIINFRNIITAQFFIAVCNTAFTALYLFIILPLFDVQMPYATALTILTFVVSMLPVVGNLVCNTVLALVSLSVGPGLAIASFVFLVVVHKVEYFINAWAVGGKTDISVWEILIAIFMGEAIFGVAGLVAAPLYYAYLKQELKQLGFS